MDMENKILSLLKKRMPEGKVPVEEIEKICREVTFDIVSTSCTEKETRENLCSLCDSLYFNVQAEKRQMSELSKPPFSTLNDVLSFLLAGLAYYASYSISDSHWVGGIVCVIVGVLCNRYLVSKRLERFFLLPESFKEESCPVLEDLVGKIMSLVKPLEKIIEQPGSDMQEKVEDMMENRYFRVLKFLYDDYKECIAAEKMDIFREKSLKNLFNYCGYELVEYTGENASFFDSSMATTVSVQTTTIPALQNKQTGECIFKGHVLFPMSKID